MIRFIIEKDNVNVAFDAPTDLLYDRLAFVRVGDIPISGKRFRSHYPVGGCKACGSDCKAVFRR